ncbi:MAG: ABC transporter ATP-binding protein [Bacillota bacterium]
MLKIKNLDFSYGSQKILDNINLAVNNGDFIGIIGPNGSGKSTLLKNISKHLDSDSGFIYLNSKLLGDINLQELARTMSVVPQETGVNYSFSVYDLVMMGRNPYQNRWGRIIEEDKRKVREALLQTDTMKFSNKNINQLSGGEKQRVILARALAQEPELLLLDEPTASLDINYQQDVFDILASLNEELNLTIIVVSHDLNLSSQYCDKLILLNKGQIYTVGHPDQVLTARNISDVYGTDVMIERNSLTDRPYVIMVPTRNKQKVKAGKNSNSDIDHENIETDSLKIHVICGGGSGKELLEILKKRNYILSTGVLNQGDSDWETAEKLEIEIVEIPPFSGINNESRERNISFIEKADVAILTDTPFGHGNIENISVLPEIKSTLIILYNKKPIKERDYTGGKAEKFWKNLITKDNVVVLTDIEEILLHIQDFSNKFGI